jgi:hypothetical protein
VPINILLDETRTLGLHHVGVPAGSLNRLAQDGSAGDDNHESSMQRNYLVSRAAREKGSREGTPRRKRLALKP